MARLVDSFVALVLLLRSAAPSHPPDFLPFARWWARSEAGSEGVGADVQVVYLPALLPREAQVSDRAQDIIPLPYNFQAFGRSFELQLVPNRRLLSPRFGVWTQDGEELSLSEVDVSCHFLHSGPKAVAAFSACKDHGLHGLIVVDNSTYEVRPLMNGVGRAEDSEGRAPHVIRRVPPPPAPADDERPIHLSRRRRPRYFTKPQKPPNYTIEIALFLDEAAYRIFHPFMNHNEAEIRDMLLAYINGVQALYQHWSLGTRIQLSLVRMTFLRVQPASLPAHAERGKLLDAFCAYQRSLNVEDDDDPQHWDMALLLSGLDLYSVEGGRRNGVTMGLAPVGGVCLPAHACVVAEFGAVDALQRPYPSAGFTSVYILAHEIGHNLGMHHDGTGNACPREGYIMSPSRGTHGEATWSPCSARAVQDLNWATCLLDGEEEEEEAPPELQHETFGGAPGATWGAKKQCEVLLRDVDAAPADEGGAGVCAQLTCRSPHRPAIVHAGPALPGTRCGHTMWCQGGECVPAAVVSQHTTSTTTTSTTTEANQSTKPSSTTKPASNNGGIGGWGPWRDNGCKSACTARARGFRERRRVCSPQRECEGSSYHVMLCDDVKVCGKKSRVSVHEWASRRCGEFAARLPELDASGGGLQAPHDPTRMWMGCAIFCRRASGGGFYAPRVELNAAGLDPYLPDGTWCHHDGSQDYFCLQHHCLPENFKMAPQWHIWDLPSEDIGGSLNARARTSSSEEKTLSAIRQYLTLDENGVPLTRSGFPPQIPEELETHWEVEDYVELNKNFSTA